MWLFLAVPGRLCGAMMRTMAAPQDSAALQRLAELVIQRRTALHMNKIDVARAAGITITTYSQIEVGQSVRDSTYGKIEPVLRWAPGSCRDILRGTAEPTLAEPSTSGDAVHSPVSAGDLADDVDQAVAGAVVAVSNTVTAPQIREIKRRVLEELRKRGRLPEIDEN